MKSGDLIHELANHIDPVLAKDLVSEFIEIQNDCKTGTLGRSSVGKFVETAVQVLQFLESGNYDKKPNVDSYLKNLEHRTIRLNDDLRICCARIARSCYTLRNKRNIAHKGSVDPNVYDLKYIYSSAQWILAEVVRNVMTSDMATAGRMIEYIQTPVHYVVEEFENRKLVFGDLTVDQEILILLHSYYPNYISRQSIKDSLDRRSHSAISNSLNKLWKVKFVHKDDPGYKLTQEGFKEARRTLQSFG